MIDWSRPLSFPDGWQFAVWFIAVLRWLLIVLGSAFCAAFADRRSEHFTPVQSSAGMLAILWLFLMPGCQRASLGEFLNGGDPMFVRCTEMECVNHLFGWTGFVVWWAMTAIVGGWWLLCAATAVYGIFFATAESEKC